MERPVGEVDIAAAASLFADETRARICARLLDGRFCTASELASDARVSASTASEHLSRLVAGGVLEAVKQGRHKYFRLAGAEVAAVLEALALVAPPVEVRSLRQHQAALALRQGRTCYDHLAGRLGLWVTDSLVAGGVMTPDFAVVDLAPLASLQLDIPSGKARPLVRPCLDWTERRYHVAGALPAEITRRLFELDWLARTTLPRAVRLTPKGVAKLEEIFGHEFTLDTGTEDRAEGDGLEASVPAEGLGS